MTAATRAACEVSQIAVRQRTIFKKMVKRRRCEKDGSGKKRRSDLRVSELVTVTYVGKGWNTPVTGSFAKAGPMNTRIDEIAPRIYRFSTFVQPAGIVFNQFLIDAEEPLLFHTGMRRLFPSVRDAVARVLHPNRLRWISFGHFEADECGAMNAWLAIAPNATVAHGEIGVIVSVADQADREPRALRDGEILDLGGKRVRYLNTPHVPHGWDAGLLYEETTATLFAGDLFTATGDRRPATARRRQPRTSSARRSLPRTSSAQQP
jgi:glyoxylase-like metal-dependent hydrolase (beta-lactamase superfamily II)